MIKDIYDLIIIGAGPSALTAAIYAAREDLKTVLYEKAVVGGMAAITDKIDNYPGFPDGIDGFELTNRMRQQAEKFGAKIETGTVTAVFDDGDSKAIIVDDKKINAKSVLIATGSSYNKLNIPGELEYYGRGVSYCATCDGAFYRNKKLAVIGGGNSAVQEAIFLTRFASHIDLLVRSTVKASEVLQQELHKIISEGKITVHTGTATEEVIAKNDTVSSVKVIKDGVSRLIDVDGVFIFAGLRPNTQFLEGSGIDLDDSGFVKTDSHMQTNISGVFASGDVRSGSNMQVASAVGEGATVAKSIREYLGSLD
jgi:thioredoxin reductase (NADPH)